MKMRMRLIIVVVVFISISCSNRKNNKVAAIVDGSEIPLSIVDASIKKELYQMLENIYLLRKQALDDVIGEKLLEMESKKLRISKDSLLALNVNRFITDSLLALKSKSLFGKVPIPNSPLKYEDVNTLYGWQLLKQYVINERRSLYVNELKEKYKANIKIYLEEPISLSPEINVKKLNVHYLAEKKHANTIIVIGSYDCENCKIAEPVVLNLYKKYKNFIDLGFVCFDSYPTISMRTVECAARQDHFLDMHERVIKLTEPLDSLNAFKFASEINLDMARFKNDFSSSLVMNSLILQINKIQGMGISQTPVIIINNKLYTGLSDAKSLEDYILKIIQ